MKLPDWATRLDAWIAAANRMPFSYDPARGLDCCRFTFSAIHAQTGIMIGQQFAGKYRTKREALLLMKSYSGKPSLQLCIHKLMAESGFERVEALMAQRGDAVLVPNGTSGDFFGVLDTNGRDVLGVGEFSVRRVPISIKCRAWRID
jgi:hypothetical protein